MATIATANVSIKRSGKQTNRGKEKHTMPWTKCLCGDGSTRLLEDCLACDNSVCADQEIKEAVIYRNRHEATEHTGDHITATSLTGCLRQLYLERTIDYSASIMSRWFTLRGELIHRLVELPDHDEPGDMAFSERRFTAELDGIPISGRIDRYKLRFLKHGMLKDFKSIGDNGLQFIIYEGAKKEHCDQVNIYKWLMEKNGFPVNYIQICYLSLMAVVRTGEPTTFFEYLVAAPARSGKRKHMVGNPRLVKSYLSGKKKWACTYQVPAVPMYDNETIEEFMRPRINHLTAAFKKGIIPPRCEPEMQAWRCEDYCYARSECERIEKCA